MNSVARAFGFFHWVGLNHYINLLFISFLVRSGIEILSAHPKLYWNEASEPGTEWIKFTKKALPSGRLWTGADEEESFSPWIALPGGRNLGMGRHWHFFSVLFWVVNGLIYVALLFVKGEWSRLLPTSWNIIPEAARTAGIYLHMKLPPAGSPYNPLQQLTYAGVVFVLAPFLILTGAGMSPAVAARFPRFLAVFGGRQRARSLHFLGLLAVCLFTIGHVFLVVADDFPRNMAWIVHGQDNRAALSIAIALVGLVVAFLLHVWATRWSLKSPRQVQNALGLVIEPAKRALLHRLSSTQVYSRSEITPFFRVNGQPPSTDIYSELAREGFSQWRLGVRGLVKTPIELSLADLHEMPIQTQITKHHCIQGWSAVAEWTGVAVSEVLKRCEPLPNACYLVFHGFDEPLPRKPYYETIDLALARRPQTILAFEMNGKPLSVEHGAPCRLRVETQLGFKMVKYLRAIEVVEDYRKIGDGQGGYREDTQFYGAEAGI